MLSDLVQYLTMATNQENENLLWTPRPKFLQQRKFPSLTSIAEDLSAEKEYLLLRVLPKSLEQIESILSSFHC